MTYPGGKGRLWRHLVSLMPPHDTYIESHLGGGAVMRAKRPATRSIGVDLDPSVITAASTWAVPGLTLHAADASEFLASYPFDGKELVYCDPPYVSATRAHRRYYRFEYSDADHERLLEVLLEIPCSVMISGYDSQLYRDRLGNWQRRELRNISQCGPRDEVVWANFDYSADLHDYGSVGGDFRERERIRRKAARWLRNLDEMSEIERKAILALINDTHGVGPARGAGALSVGERR